MGTQFPALLVDDGELSDVRDLLSEMGVEFAHLRGGAIPARVDPPRDLFVTTARRALLARPWPAHSGGPGRPAKVAVVTEDSETLRGALRQLGFGYLVRRPVHPAALRLLLLCALYRGDEKRGETRVAVGYEVSVRSGFRPRTGMLEELSTSGCRLAMDRPPGGGKRLTVLLPPEIAGGRALALPGRVVRIVGAAKNRRDEPVSAAVRFESLDSEELDRLWAVVRAFESGPASLPAPPKDAGAGEAGRRRGAGWRARVFRVFRERRQEKRAQYSHPVLADRGDESRVVLGRELSASGMRIDPIPKLAVGAHLSLILYGGGRDEPVRVDAVVARDDGTRGLALRFENVEPAVASRLENLVAALPAVEVLERGETGSLGTVLSEILPR